VTAGCVTTLPPALAAAAITIGETSLNQSGEKPDGFTCKNVESRVDTNDLVGDHVACREERIAAAPAAAGMSQAAPNSPSGRWRRRHRRRRRLRRRQRRLRRLSRQPFDTVIAPPRSLNHR
jgi:hypothetical protein